MFSYAGATRVHMPTVPTNVAMRTVLERLGFVAQGTAHEPGLEFVFYVAREAWSGAAAEIPPA
jgi:RimJ/RimL family protein N-acetyltransferase